MPVKAKFEKYSSLPGQFPKLRGPRQHILVKPLRHLPQKTLRKNDALVRSAVLSIRHRGFAQVGGCSLRPNS